MNQPEILMHLNKGTIILISFLALLIGTSCSATRRTSVEDQRRGLLMLENENVYKNRGFYKPKNAKKIHRQNMRAARRRIKRR